MLNYFIYNSSSPKALSSAFRIIYWWSWRLVNALWNFDNIWITVICRKRCHALFGLAKPGHTGKLSCSLLLFHGLPKHPWKHSLAIIDVFRSSLNRLKFLWTQWFSHPSNTSTIPWLNNFLHEFIVLERLIAVGSTPHTLARPNVVPVFSMLDDSPLIVPFLEVPCEASLHYDFTTFFIRFLHNFWWVWLNYCMLWRCVVNWDRWMLTSVS